MKTIQLIKSEIEDLKKDILDIRNTENNKSKAKRRENLVSEKIRFRSLIIMYLETNPSEDFVKSSYDELVKNKRLLESRYESWKYNSFVAEKGNDPKARYAEISGLTEINKKIKTMEYLLN